MIGNCSRMSPSISERDPHETAPERGRNQLKEEAISVFGNIVSAIFGSKHAAGVTQASMTGGAAPSPSKGSTAAASPSADNTGTTAHRPLIRKFIFVVQYRPDETLRVRAVAPARTLIL